MQAKTEAEIQHLVNLSGITISMIRNPDFLRDFAASDSQEQNSIQTCLEILADTAVALMQKSGTKPRYRMRALTRPHGFIPPPHPIDEVGQAALFPENKWGGC